MESGKIINYSFFFSTKNTMKKTLEARKPYVVAWDVAKILRKEY